MMKHRIEVIEDRLIVGMKTQTSVLTINEKTKQLAKLFMPRRHEVASRIGEHVFSIQDYGDNYSPTDFNSEFDKWVAVEVKDSNDLPEGMDSFIIKSGTYVVFSFKGSVSEFPKSRAYIFQEWLPNSEYQLDPKAHFEILSENYSKDLQNIEEDIWIPVRKK
ncbi:GyrI-like domain-containing protein [Psychroserpens ponticola]|uniref:GyrI-like domain-containing protein n=1 Tax=Psychroserpens ponticola TaxID=2932268 RepID=A0ABY7RZF8_9FLAO|nr:GyrI-like domain-containing protein [Psychroserpens ponticola]WCO02090.1 GyrI-like domain-containing protein [Psychroserpens ponticola]